MYRYIYKHIQILVYNIYTSGIVLYKKPLKKFVYQCLFCMFGARNHRICFNSVLTDLAKKKKKEQAHKRLKPKCFILEMSHTPKYHDLQCVRDY